ncbi:MAG: hypothetical protein ABI360_03610 [Allobranchiibius sp.]
MSATRQRRCSSTDDVGTAGRTLPTRSFRSPSAWFYSGSVWVLCAVCAVLAVAQEPWPIAAQVLLTLATVALLTWTVLCRPHLTVGDRDITVSNVLRTHVIPLGAVRFVRTRGLVEIVATDPAAKSGERTYRSWNAPGNQAPAPRRSEVHAQTHPGRPVTSVAERRARSGALPASSGVVQQLIEERMDTMTRRPTEQVANRWNTPLLLTCAIALLLTLCSWSL